MHHRYFYYIFKIVVAGVERKYPRRLDLDVHKMIEDGVTPPPCDCQCCHCANSPDPRDCCCYVQCKCCY